MADKYAVIYRCSNCLFRSDFRFEVGRFAPVRLKEECPKCRSNSDLFKEAPDG